MRSPTGLAKRGETHQTQRCCASAAQTTGTDPERDESYNARASRYVQVQHICSGRQFPFFVIRLTEPFPVFSAAEEPPASTSASPPAESASKPLKRLFIKTNCKWLSNTDRIFVLKKLCEAMARQQLTKPFWIKQYHIIPISETVHGTGDTQCIQYRVQVTMAKAEREKLQIPNRRRKILKPAAEQEQVNGTF